MLTETTALLIREVNGPFALETVQLDQLKPDEALVEIHATGICHTDISIANGTLPGWFPAVLGHEGAGRILELGDNVAGFSQNDRVLLSFAGCMECAQCTSGHPAYCYSFTPFNFSGKRLDGSSAMSVRASGGDCAPAYSSFFGQSSFARHAVVHKSSMVKVPADTPLDLFCPLGCGLQTGAGAVLNTLNVKPGSSLAVFGVGSVGLSAVMAGKMRGAKTIIAVDLNPARLETAKSLGATHGILGSDADLVAQIQKICPPNGVNYAVDCSGVPQVVEKMIESLGTKGRAATVGAPTPGKKASIDIFAHLILGREYVGCCEGDSNTKEFIPYLVEQNQKGLYPLDRLVTVYDMKDYEKALAEMKDGKTIKAVLRWESEERVDSPLRAHH